MPQLSSNPRRRLRRVLPLVTCLLWLGGCDGGGGSKTADFPNMSKPNIQSSTPKKPAKGMDRVGSESYQP
jgi:hypothetical protein